MKFQWAKNWFQLLLLLLLDSAVLGVSSKYIHGNRLLSTPSFFRLKRVESQLVQAFALTIVIKITLPFAINKIPKIHERLQTLDYFL